MKIIERQHFKEKHSFSVLKAFSNVIFIFTKVVTYSNLYFIFLEFYVLPHCSNVSTLSTLRDKCEKYLLKYSSVNDLSCFTVSGFSLFFMASTLSALDIMPFGIISKVRTQKCYFLLLILHLGKMRNILKKEIA